MRSEKLSLKSIKNALSRSEMKTIMAGSGSGGGGGGGGGGCTNLGLTIPCCQCWTTGGPSCGTYVYIDNNPPLNTHCDCFCKSRGYAGGYDDCPIGRC